MSAARNRTAVQYAGMRGITLKHRKTATNGVMFMNDQQLGTIADSLRDRVVFLKQQCGLAPETAAAVIACPDENEQASRLAELTLDVALRGRLARQLAAVESALHRIATGGFGRCEECGDEIGEARLKANPTTTLCIHCQEDREAEAARRYLLRDPVCA